MIDLSLPKSPHGYGLCGQDLRYPSTTRTLSAIFVGGGSLSIRCAQTAKEMGCSIPAVLPTDDVFRAWATNLGIRCYDNVEQIYEFLYDVNVDLIFSVVNPVILPAHLLERARVGAFNYHDSPLPRHAGTHATSWAILAQESQYAISWHNINSGIDTGNVVVRCPVSIASTDTAMTLNLKCYEAAIEGFRALLAMIIAGADLQGSPQAAPVIMPVGRDGALPLSYSQQRLWFLSQLDEDSTNYNIPLGWRLQGRLDRVAWRRSLDRLFARHEALRCTFVAGEDDPQVQILSGDRGLPVVEHDLRDRPDAQAALLDLCQEEARTPFDLAREPLIRGRLIRLADEEHVFLLTQHHIVSDGWSMGVLVRELSSLYRAFEAGEDDPLPPLAIQYPDYAAWQRQWLSGERLQRQAQYWRDTLSGAPARLALPTDRPRPAQQSFAGTSVPVVIDQALTRGLKRLSRQHGTTLFMTVLAAWAAVLSRLSGQDDIVIGVPTANRRRREIEDLIGFFVNTLAVRIDLSGEPSVSDLLERARRAALTAQDHQDLPFEQVVEIVQPPRALDHTPLFQVGLAWQNNTVGSLDLPGLRVEAAGEGLDQVKFDLELNLGEQGEVIAGTLGYATALFDRATIERQCGYLLALLRAMLADAEQPVRELDILPAEERSYLLEELNRTEADYP
ncbi:condensation domain-containing protein, partial [Sinorhizobium meliloti]|uniref:condensation domain-containing protein n=3 Tax=Rhizobium meliloti TaxID=382 RepID=UPI000FE0232A